MLLKIMPREKLGRSVILNSQRELGAFCLLCGICVSLPAAGGLPLG